MVKKHSTTLVLLDAHAIIHRAYHALPDFSSSKGEPTGALYGLSTMLMKIIQELNPDYIAACFDLPKPTQRHEMFPDYKGGRKKADLELQQQLERSRDVFNAFGIPLYDSVGFEADDILGTICEQLKQDAVNIIIASGDMDTLQLVEKDRVSVYTLRKGIQDTMIYDEEAVKDRFGFEPSLLTDYKGLRGDPSDNIPGIRGIGEKTATTLIVTFGTIEDIYQQLEEDEQQFLDAGIKPRIITLLREGKDEAYFSKMLATIRRDAPITYTLPEKVWRETIALNEIHTLFSELEFRTLGERVKKLLGAKDEVMQDEVMQEDIDTEDLKRTALALWLLQSDTTNPTREDIIQFSGSSYQQSKKDIFAMLDRKGLTSVYKNIEEPLLCVVEDMNTNGIALDIAYLKKLSKEYHATLSEMESKIYQYAGVEFNINSPKQLGSVLFDTLKLHPKNQKRTATGQRSTKESELEKLRGEHPIIEYVFMYRELQKLLSTYIDTLPDLVGEDGRLHAEFIQAGTTTGRMASQNPNLQNIPIKTEQGRRVRNAFIAEEGHVLVALDYSQIELRLAAILSKDEKLLSIFSSGGDVHTAVAAEVFNVPPEMVDGEMRRQAKVINFGILYGMGVNALKKNLGGATTQKEARNFYNTYFQQYSGLAKWIDHTKADAARVGYTKTLFGRRRYFAGMQSPLPHIKAAAERMAVNAPIQGTQADVVKIAMVQAHRYIAENGLSDSVKLVLQVHDELVYEMREDIAEATTNAIRQIMETVLTKEETHGIALLVDVTSGPNWGEMK
tara:strand:- start:1992 stop:4349 length:2358 start_codon:yes stop_codon:yes gene_type:complete